MIRWGYYGPKIQSLYLIKQYFLSTLDFKYSEYESILSFNKYCKALFDSKERLKRSYELHNAFIESNVPKARLLCRNSNDDLDKLESFLGHTSIVTNEKRKKSTKKCHYDPTIEGNNYLKGNLIIFILALCFAVMTTFSVFIKRDYMQV